jgi:hypothetical protein
VFKDVQVVEGDNEDDIDGKCMCENKTMHQNTSSMTRTFCDCTNFNHVNVAFGCA